MKAPTDCIFWREPQRITARPMAELFERLETFVEESHWWRHLLKCRECGQRYFFEFYEQIDWQAGEDPQYSTWIPVETDVDIEALKATDVVGLLEFTPRLSRDFPKGRTASRVYWVRGET